MVCNGIIYSPSSPTSIPPFSLPLINLRVSVDVKHHIMYIMCEMLDIRNSTFTHIIFLCFCHWSKMNKQIRQFRLSLKFSYIMTVILHSCAQFRFSLQLAYITIVVLHFCEQFRLSLQFSYIMTVILHFCVQFRLFLSFSNPCTTHSQSTYIQERHRRHSHIMFLWTT